MRAYQYCQDMLHQYLTDLPLVFTSTSPSCFDGDKNYLYLNVITSHGTHFTHAAEACHEAAHAIDYARWPRLFALRNRSRYFFLGYLVNLFLEWHASKLAYQFLKSTGDFTPYELQSIKRLYRKSFNTYL